MTADPAEFDAPMLDHHGLDLSAAMRITYRVEQSFRYTYQAPITALSQRLVIVPRPRHGDLHRRAHAVRVTGALCRRRTYQDQTDNTVVRVTAARVQHSVEFTVTAVLERIHHRGWPVVAAHVRGDPALHQPTRLTAADDRLRDQAAALGQPSDDPLDLAERVCAAVFGAMTYQYGVTNVATTAAEALAAGKGVCQDAAHIMLALCHLLRLPARYVSGHLLGQGGTHAWVEVIVPHRDAAMAVGFDPCHGRRTDNRYVTVAVGRDYADVAPTSGTFVGRPGGALTGTRQVGIIRAE